LNTVDEGLASTIPLQTQELFHRDDYDSSKISNSPKRRKKNQWSHQKKVLDNPCCIRLANNLHIEIETGGVFPFAGLAIELSIAGSQAADGAGFQLFASRSKSKFLSFIIRRFK
jgi:hypothetical protein